jgi:hypothetical protein
MHLKIEESGHIMKIHQEKTSTSSLHN